MHAYNRIHDKCIVLICRLSVLTCDITWFLFLYMRDIIVSWPPWKASLTHCFLYNYCISNILDTVLCRSQDNTWFPMSNVVVLLMFYDLRGEVIVCFVYIGGIVDHHCLNFLFIILIIYLFILDSQPQVIKLKSCLPMVSGSLRVLRLLPPLKLVAMI